MFIRPFKTSLISILFVLCIAPMLYAENVPGLKVSYDPREDLLTVDANNVPLTHILAQIATQSGIEIIVDPSIEKEITISLQKQPLEKALKKIVDGLSYAMHYDKTDYASPSHGYRLVAIKIVPQGKRGSGNLVSVTHPDALSGQPDGRGDGNYDEGNNDATLGRRKGGLTEKGMGARQRDKIMQNEDPDPSDAASFSNE